MKQGGIQSSAGVIELGFGEACKKSDWGGDDEMSYYTQSYDAAGLPACVAVFADRPHIRREISEDLIGGGFRTTDGGTIDALLNGPIAILGDVVMLDCPVIDASILAALARLDMRIAKSGAQLIVSTSLDALDDVFASLDQSDAQILVQPTRAERVIAVGRVAANIANGRVREMSEEDRLSLLHLSRQVELIAQTLEGLSEHSGGNKSAFDPGAAKGAIEMGTNSDVNISQEQASGGLVDGPPTRFFNTAHPSLPDPRFVRQIIAKRQARARFFDADLFADPVWDMLLDLTAAQAEMKNVSVTSLCIAAAVPATTALRWVKQMVDTGIFERIADPSDKRRAFIALSESSTDAMARYFNEVEIPMAKAA